MTYLLDKPSISAWIEKPGERTTAQVFGFGATRQQRDISSDKECYLYQRKTPKPSALLTPPVRRGRSIVGLFTGVYADEKDRMARRTAA